MSQPRLKTIATPPLAPNLSDEDQDLSDEDQDFFGEDEVLAALLGLGAAAHVDDIVERVALERGRLGFTGALPVRLMVETALDRMRTPDDRPHGDGGGCVYRPFGSASRRWAVCRDHAALSLTAPPARGPGAALLKR